MSFRLAEVGVKIKSVWIPSSPIQRIYIKLFSNDDVVRKAVYLITIRGIKKMDTIDPQLVLGFQSFIYILL